MVRRAFIVISASETAFRTGAGHGFSETGGLLIGYWTQDDDVVVAETTHSGPRARRSPFGFEPDIVEDDEVIARKFAETQGALTYVGDWHTHPLGPLRPSRRDHIAARLVAKSPEARTPRPLVAIVRPYLHLFGRSFTVPRLLPKMALYCFDPAADRLRLVPVHFLTGVPQG